MQAASCGDLVLCDQLFWVHCIESQLAKPAMQAASSQCTAVTARLSANTTMKAGFKFGFLVSLPKTLFTYPPIHFKKITRISGYLKSQNLEIQITRISG